jgi:hypothetical protein
MAFVSAITKQANFVHGVNGALKLNTSGSIFVDAFTNLNKNTPVDYIDNIINKMIKEVHTISDLSNREFAALNIFRMWVHKRHVRDGEKEKLLSYRYFLALYNIFPETCCKIVESGLFGEIGYWKDGLLIWGLINDMDISKQTKFDKYNNLIVSIRKSILDRRSKDLKMLFQYVLPNRLRDMKAEDLRKFKTNSDKDKPSLSRVGEWCVRESSPENKHLCWYIFDESGNLVVQSHVSFMIRASLKEKIGGKSMTWPVSKGVPFGAKKSWRQLNSLLNEYLEITETRMASNRWDLVNPSSVPAVCSSKHMKAFLNEDVKTPPEPYEEDTGNRYPEDLMRVGLRNRTRDMFVDPSKMNVGSLFPHQIGYRAITSKSLATKDYNHAAWEKKIIDTKLKFDEIRARIGDEVSEVAAAMASGNIVACADVSASMTWVDKVPNQPLQIAVGLACFISCVASDKFRDIALSFKSDPYCFSFKKSDGTSMNVSERWNAMIKHSGGSTNYEGLHDVLITLCTLNKVPEDELPVLWIGTDGEFDEMGGLRPISSYCSGNSVSNWETMHQSIEKKWINAGYKKVPLIVYHNLNSESNGVQVDQTYKGVILLSGRSESVLQYILYGEAAGEETKIIEVDGKKVEVKVSSITPYDIFAKAMEDDKYASLEYVLKNSDEWKRVTKLK